MPPLRSIDGIHLYRLLGNIEIAGKYHHIDIIKEKEEHSRNKEECPGKLHKFNNHRILFLI